MTESSPSQQLDSDFYPPLPLRQADIQNLLSSLGLRGYLLKRQSHEMEQRTRSCIVDGGKGVRLSGEVSIPSQASSGLVILIHGWEGSSQSAYIVSAALSLFEAGFTVFRLNLRDHGDSHHLNEALFNSTLLDEVLNSIADIQTTWPHEKNFLAGYSLGGNFALRIALQCHQFAISLDQVAAICPVINPADTLHSLQNARFFYESYFTKKWRNSLLKKLEHYPHYNYRKDLMALKDLASMHDFFVPRFTDYSTDTAILLPMPWMAGS